MKNNKNTIKNKRVVTRKITVAGSLGALTVILGITKLGLIPWFAGASITVMHLPVIIGTILEGPVVGMIIGGIFGLFSMLNGIISPTSPLDPQFANPLISVLPRILIAVMTFAVYYPLSKIKKLPKLIVVAISSFTGSISNSFFVLGMLTIYKAIDFKAFCAILVSNSILESVAAVIVCTVVIGICKGISNRNKSKLSEIESEQDSDN